MSVLAPYRNRTECVKPGFFCFVFRPIETVRLFILDPGTINNTSIWVTFSILYHDKPL